MSQTGSPARLAVVRSRIAAAAVADKRAADAVTLIAVSKTFGAGTSGPCSRPATASLARTGCRKPRQNGRQLRQDYPGVSLHLIGPLQSNKAKEAVLLFDAIHSIDRPKIAEAVAEEILKQGSN